MPKLAVYKVVSFDKFGRDKSRESLYRSSINYTLIRRPDEVWYTALYLIFLHNYTSPCTLIMKPIPEIRCGYRN